MKPQPNERQQLKYMWLGDNVGLFGIALVPVMSDDKETIRIALVADVGRVSSLVPSVEVHRVPLGDYGTITATELRAKLEAVTAPEVKQ